ncbi:Sec-independent protein translocase protein TatB [Acinetobacter nematophilus]|uniref:Sec-independent protein translocase protein TatB n=1 Tax=Acinetobacter nematophilus TaxID=2994642 RepID=UPI003AF57008
MLNVGLSELFVFGIIALLVLGPEKLPEAARFAGKWYAKILYFVKNTQNDIDRELRLSELREQIQQEMQRMAELEQKMQSQLSELKQQSLTDEIHETDLKTSSIPQSAKLLQYQYLNIEKADLLVFIPYQTSIYLKIQNDQIDNVSIKTTSIPPVQLKVIA